MRSTCRLFMAAILFTVVAGFASAQDTSAAPPPPPAPVVTEPVAELPVIPGPEPEVPAVEPALAADQSAPPVEPVVPAIVEAPVEVPAVEQPAVTTVKRVTKKTAKKPAEKPAILLSETLEAAAPAASTAATDTTANAPPPDAVAGTAPLKSIAAPLPSVQAAAVEGSEETKSEYTMGIGGWLIAGLVVAALVGVITLFRRRRTLRRTSIVNLKTITPELKPALVTRP